MGHCDPKQIRVKPWYTTLKEQLPASTQPMAHTYRNGEYVGVKPLVE